MKIKKSSLLTKTDKTVQSRKPRVQLNYLQFSIHLDTHPPNHASTHIFEALHQSYNRSTIYKNIINQKNTAYLFLNECT